MATLTVRNLDEGIVRRLRLRAAEHGRSTEAEHREILCLALAAEQEAQSGRTNIAQRLADFRQRTAGRGSSSAAVLLNDARSGRLNVLIGPDESR